ncbi:protein phosphatase 2C [Physcia stellaris]|nr:protein phosphatase 2C [Physcia stellaris]
MRSSMPNNARQIITGQAVNGSNNVQIPRRSFHEYFVTHLPSSSLHPDSRSAAGPSHQLPRAASKPHTTDSGKGPSPAPLPGVSRDTTVVRIPLRSAKHHFGVSVSRGSRPYNEDAYQSGVIELPAFAKRAPINLTRAPANSPLQAYRESQRKQQEQARNAGDGEGTSAEGASGDPQVAFLRESLHEHIEDAALKYDLESSLTGKSDKRGRPGKETEPAVTTPTITNSSISEDSSGKSDPAKDRKTSAELQSALIKSWRETVGGYFRRFQPSAFSSDIPQPTISTILTYAFLTADLTFIRNQLRLLKSDSDPVAADLPINTSDISPHPTSSSPPKPPASRKPFKGGSTCSIALISTPTPTPFWHPSTPSTLLTAHCGDTRILLSRVSDGAAHPLTTDHHPNTPSEAARLRRFAASFVTDSFGEERLSGLANTRAFGDMPSKRMGVSAEPEIRRTELGASEYAFLTLLSDGVSGVMSDQEVVDVVKEAKTPEQGARDVVAFATEVGVESGGDNCTCLVVRLGGWERRGRAVGSLGTREGREWRRREAGDPRRGRT